MEELIAKRYVKALASGLDIDTLKKMSEVFFALSGSFNDAKFQEIMSSPNVSMEQKSEILMGALKKSDSKEIENFIKVLVEKKRIMIIPAIAECMRKDIATLTKTYVGTVYSDTEIDSQVMKDLGVGLGNKFGSNITLDFVKGDFDGIKVDVADLGVEINFSKTRINSQMINHIVKAI